MGPLRNRGPGEVERARVPPGQHVVRDFPVLHAGDVPYRTPPADWDLRIWGRVAEPVRWTLDEVRALPSRVVTCDIHCVTTWSKLGTVWEGVPLTHVLEIVEPLPDATHVVAHAEEGYTANLPLERLRAHDVLLAYAYDGRDLEPEHGGPLRLLVPSLYFWKSAKWLRGLEILDHDEPGFWERLGYSNGADPWKEERHGF